MAVSGLEATTEYAREARYRAPDRRWGADRANWGEAEPSPVTAGVAAADYPFDAAYYASRFKADVSQLKDFVATTETGPSDPSGDHSVFDFFGNLSVLLVAVRAGDIERAQAAADALEMEALVERSAGRRPGAAASERMLDDLGRLFSAGRARDEGAARAAASELATEVYSAFARPRPSVPFAEPPTAEAVAPDGDDGGAAYETLAHYLDGDPEAA